MAVRTVFAADDETEEGVRARIAAALRTGRLDGPRVESRWTVLRESAATPTDAECDFVARQPGDTGD